MIFYPNDAADLTGHQLNNTPDNGPVNDLWNTSYRAILQIRSLPTPGRRRV
jgi:hypothetical protein